jgi:hypothetical protein
MPAYDTVAGWKNADEQPEFIKKNKLRFMRT